MGQLRHGVDGEVGVGFPRKHLGNPVVDLDHAGVRRGKDDVGGWYSP